MREREPTSILLPATREVLERAEDVSGNFIRLIPDPLLGDLAQARILLASEGLPYHELRYNPSHPAVDHLVAHECGHLLRLWSVPPEERLRPVIDEGARRRAAQAMRRQLEGLETIGLADDAIRQVFDLWHQGSVLQLINTPQDMRIETWLHAEYPSLRESQERSLRRMLTECIAVFAERPVLLTPPMVVKANSQLNAAAAHQFSALFGDGAFVAVYGRFGLAAKGRQRAHEVLDVADDGYRGDRRIVERWAAELGIKGWFGWVSWEQGGKLGHALDVLART